MKKITMLMFTVFVSTMSFLSYAGSGQSGIIIFTGQVVESACDVGKVTDGKMNSSCYYSRKNEDNKIEKVDYNIKNLISENNKSYSNDRYTLTSNKVKNVSNLYRIKIDYK